MTRTPAPFIPPPHQLPPIPPLAVGLARLACHPDTPEEAVIRLHVAIALEADGRLTLHYHLRGALAQLRIADADAQLPADRLWGHTCFEVFIGSEDAPAYREFNFAPSGQWAAYAFSTYRERIDDAPPGAPQLEILRSGDLLMLSATLPAAALPPDTPVSRLRVGLSTVVEAADGRLSYWALAHPGDRPDFHDARSFCWQASAPVSSF